MRRRGRGGRNTYPPALGPGRRVLHVDGLVLAVAAVAAAAFVLGLGIGLAL